MSHSCRQHSDTLTETKVDPVNRKSHIFLIEQLDIVHRIKIMYQQSLTVYYSTSRVTLFIINMNIYCSCQNIQGVIKH